MLALVSEGELDELSIPAVARRSGASAATIYRYFPNRDQLLAAAAQEPARQAVAADPVAAADGGDPLAAFMGTMWRELSRNLPLLRHQVSSAAGREMRQARLEQSRGMTASYLASRGVDPTSPDGERVVALILLVTGSLGLVELHDRQGLPVERAIDTAGWALQVLVEAAAEPRERSEP